MSLNRLQLDFSAPDTWRPYLELEEQLNHGSSRNKIQPLRKTRQASSRAKKEEDRSFWLGLISSPRLNDEEKLLVRLRKLDGLPWKEVLHRYNLECHRQYRSGVLEMRLSRLTKKMKVWVEKSGIFDYAY